MTEEKKYLQEVSSIIWTNTFKQKLESLFYLQLVYTFKHIGGSLFASSRRVSDSYLFNQKQKHEHSLATPKDIS